MKRRLYKSLINVIVTLMIDGALLLLLNERGGAFWVNFGVINGVMLLYVAVRLFVGGDKKIYVDGLLKGVYLAGTLLNLIFALVSFESLPVCIMWNVILFGFFGIIFLATMAKLEKKTDDDNSEL